MNDILEYLQIDLLVYIPHNYGMNFLPQLCVPLLNVWPSAQIEMCVIVSLLFRCFRN